MKKALRITVTYIIVLIIALALSVFFFWLSDLTGSKLYGLIFGFWIAGYAKRIYKYLFDDTF